MMSIQNVFLFGLLSLAAQGSPAPDVLHGNSRTLSGRPTLILESGGGEGMGTWRPLVPFFKDWGAVFVYRRAGYGKTKQGTFPRTGRQIASELHEHLGQIGLKPPYVLAGHSAGGLFIRVFQQMYPKEVAGMVLIDPYTHTAGPCLRLRDEYFRKNGKYPIAREVCELPKGAPQPIQSELDHLDETERHVA